MGFMEKLLKCESRGTGILQWERIRVLCDFFFNGERREWGRRVWNFGFQRSDCGVYGLKTRVSNGREGAGG